MSKEKETEKVEEEIKEVENPKEEPKGEIPEVNEQDVTLDNLQKEIDKLTRSLVNKTEEAERVHNKLSKLEQKEQDDKLAEMSEIEKLQAQISEKDAALLKAQEELNQKTLNEQKLNIAAKVGLPEVLTYRLQGETPEEMEADAQAIMEGLPKRQVRLPVTNPGDNASRDTESVADALKRLGM